MDHSFTASLANNTLCVKCKRTEIDHTNEATCEACGRVGPCQLSGNILECQSCYDADIKAALEYQSQDKQEERLNNHQKTLLESVKIDQSIELSSDFFNAATRAIVDDVKAIEDDASVTNKPFAKAERIHTRVQHFQKVLFDAEQTALKARNEIRAGQQYLNQIVNQLREEEKAQFKLKDINYQVSEPKKPRASAGTKKVATSQKKINMAEINMWATRANTTGSIIHVMMIQHGITAEAAARDYARKMNIDLKD